MQEETTEQRIEVEEATNGHSHPLQDVETLQPIGAGGHAMIGKKFTSQNQPPPEAKRAGWSRRRSGAKLAQLVLASPFKSLDEADIKAKNQAAEFFDMKPKDVTVEIMMHFKQAEKAIRLGDTNAYHALMARAFGMPKLTQEITNPDGSMKPDPLSTTNNKLVISIAANGSNGHAFRTTGESIDDAEIIDTSISGTT